MKKILISFSILCFLGIIFPEQALARTFSAGFSKDQLWFSKDPFFAGDSIVISTLIYNSSLYRMEGSVILKDGTTTVEKRTFIIEKGASQVVDFPWVATSGNHNFSALIERNQFISGTSSVSASSIATSETAKVKRFADFDINKNGIGDSTEPTPVKKATTSVFVVPTNPVKTIEQKIVDEAPTPVSSVAIPVIGVLESVRVDQAGKSSKNLDTAEGQIAAHLGTTTESLRIQNGGRSGAGWSLMKSGITDGQIFHSPFDYVKLFLALLTHLLTSNPYVFYVLLLLVSYKLIRLTIGLFI